MRAPPTITENRATPRTKKDKNKAQTQTNKKAAGTTATARNITRNQHTWNDVVVVVVVIDVREAV